MSNKNRANQPDGPPPLLKRLYGDRAQTLHQTLINLSAASNRASTLPSILVKEHDHPDYATKLLHNTYCILNPAAPPLIDGFSLQQTATQLELLNRAIGSLLQTAATKNVLCYGYRKNRPSASGQMLQGVPHAESYAFSSSTAALQTPPWQLLLSRIGDTLMLYLLLHSSIFYRLPNNCCLQLSGIPLADVVRTWKAGADFNVINAFTARGAVLRDNNNAENEQAGAEDTAVNRERDGGIGYNILTQNVSDDDIEEDIPQNNVSPINNNNEQQQQQQIEEASREPLNEKTVGQEGVIVNGKKRRASSWQRKKAKKAAAALAAENNQANNPVVVVLTTTTTTSQAAALPTPPPFTTQLDDDTQQPSKNLSFIPDSQEEEEDYNNDDGNEYNEMDETVEEEILPPTEPQEEDMDLCQDNDNDAGALEGNNEAAAGFGTTTTSNPGGGGGGGGRKKASKLHAYGRWPRSLPRPSDMNIIRSILYTDKFPKRAGFPAQHILNRIGGRKGAGRILFSSIFSKAYNQISRRLMKGDRAAYVVLPPPVKRVKAKQRHVLAFLQQLAERAVKCPYGVLLNKYCPLPPSVARYPINPDAKPQGGIQPAGPSLDTLMDELHQIEQEQGNALPQQQQERVHAHGTKRRRISPSSAAASGGVVQIKRAKETGLEKLILTAGSHLNQAANNSSQPTAPPINLTNLPTGTADDQLHQSLPNHHKNKNINNSGGTPPLVGISMSQPGLTRQSAPNNHLGNDANLQKQDNQPTPTANNGNDPVPTTTAGVLPSSLGQSVVTEGSAQELLSCFVPHDRVTDFTWSVVRRIVPKELLGDKRARAGLKDSIRRFIGLRRWESLNIHQAVQGIPISGLPWLHGASAWSSSKDNNNENNKKQTVPPNEAAARHRNLCLWVGWLFSILVVPILRSSFYCTESEAYRQHLFYYRKPVWAKLASAYIRTLKQTQFTGMSRDEAKRVLNQRKLGVARLRLLPKKSGMRFIINLGNSSRVIFRGRKALPGNKNAMNNKRSKKVFQQRKELSFAPVNSLLQSLYQVLKYEASRQPAVLGASVFGYNDIFCKLQPFVRRVKALAAAAANNNNNKNNSQQQLYVVSVDVSRAFDHVDIDVLLQLVEPLLQSDEYLVVKYHEVVQSLGAVRVVHRRAAVRSSTNLLPFTTLASRLAEKFRNKAFTDQVVYEKVTRIELLGTLRQHLSANIIKIKKQWHQMSRGIAQGSTLGTLLCCLYLAHVEKKYVLPIISQPVENRRHKQQHPSAVHAVNIPPAAAATTGIITQQPSVAGGGPSSSIAHRAVGQKQQQSKDNASLSRGGITQLAYAAGDALPSIDIGPSTHMGQQQGVLAGGGASTVTTSFGGVLSNGHSDVSARSQASASLLLRLVDDWLLVTTQPAVAYGVARRLVEGIPELNIVVNPLKTKLSFPFVMPDGTRLEPAVVEGEERGKFLKWCGLLVNTSTLEVQGDYTRFVGEHISTSLTIPLGRQPGAALGIKLCHYLRPKVHPLLLDSYINSADTIRLNIYQAFLFAAMKFHSYVRTLQAAPAPGSLVLENAMNMGITFMYQLSRPRKVVSFHLNVPAVVCDTVISRTHVRYLGLYAFKVILSRKQALYKQLLAYIKEELKTPGCLRCAKRMESVVDPRKSAVFDDILY